MKRHPQILQRQQSALLIVDVQQKINAVVLHRNQVLERIVTLIRASRRLDIPTFITEQYPKGLGPTEPEILQALEGTVPMQKMTFSCCGEGGVVPDLREKNVRQVVVVGIEAHVCVLQTALDLIAEGYQVQVPCDAVSSRKSLDYETALQRMAGAGAILTTVEAVLFEWLARAGTPEFKEISRFIK